MSHEVLHLVIKEPNVNYPATVQKPKVIILRSREKEVHQIIRWEKLAAA